MQNLNDRQRRFAELVVQGRPAGRAYEEAGYKARGDVADQAGSRLLGNVKVSAYVQELREAAKKRGAMELDEALDFLARAIRTPIGEVDETSDLCQEYTVEEVRTRYKSVSKMEAMKQLAQMLGWNKPEIVPVAQEVRVIIGGNAQ